MTKSIEALSAEVMIDRVLPYLAKGFRELINFGKVNKRCWNLLEKVPLKGAWSMAASARGYNFKLDDYEYAHKQLTTLNLKATSREVIKYACYQKSLTYKPQLARTGQDLDLRFVPAIRDTDIFEKQLKFLAEAGEDKRFLTNMTLYHLSSKERVLEALKDCPNVRDLTLENFTGAELTLNSNLRSLTLRGAEFLKDLNLGPECLNIQNLVLIDTKYPINIKTPDDAPTDIELSLIWTHNNPIEFPPDLANPPCCSKVRKLSINKISISNLVLLLRLFPDIQHLKIENLNLDGVMYIDDAYARNQSRQILFSLPALMSLEITLDCSRRANFIIQPYLLDLRKCPKLVNFTLSQVNNQLIQKTIIVSTSELYNTHQELLVNNHQTDGTFWYTDFALAKSYAYKNIRIQITEEHIISWILSFIYFSYLGSMICFLIVVGFQAMGFGAMGFGLGLLMMLFILRLWLYLPFMPSNYANVHLPTGYRGTEDLPLMVKY